MEAELASAKADKPSAGYADDENVGSVETGSQPTSAKTTSYPGLLNSMEKMMPVFLVRDTGTCQFEFTALAEGDTPEEALANHRKGEWVAERGFDHYDHQVCEFDVFPEDADPDRDQAILSITPEELREQSNGSGS